MDISELNGVKKQISGIFVDEEGFFQIQREQQYKKEPLLSVFLAKIDTALLIEMKQYLKSPKPAFRKNKIQLYEDIAWIVRFKEEEDRLNLNKIGAIRQIANDLEIQFGRRSSTIKQRVQKCLSRIEPADIRRHLQIKADFCFDSKRRLIETKYKKKDKVQCPKQERGTIDKSSQTQVEQTFQLPYTSNKFVVSENKRTDFSIRQSKQQLLKPKNLRVTTSTKQSMLKSEATRNKPIERIIPNSQDNLQINSISSKSSTSFPTSVYKYGSKPIKQQIFICYNIIEDNFFCVSQTFLKQKLPKLSTQTTDPEAKIDNEYNHVLGSQPRLKTQLEVINIPENESQSDESETPTHYDGALTSEQMKRDYEQTKRRLSSIMKGLQSNQKSTIVNSNPKSHSRKKQLPIKQEKSSDESEPAENIKAEELIKKQVLESRRYQKQSEYQDLIYQLSNNIEHLNLIREEPSLKNRYIWSKEEDKILQLFSGGNPLAFNQYLTCLMRYKTLDIIKERCNFLKITLDDERQKILDKLWQKIKERF